MGAVLGDPLLRALKVGDHVDLVVKVFEQLSHGSRAVAMWHDEACVLRGNCLPVGIWTLYGYQISGFGSDGAELQVCSESACYQRPAVDAGAFTRVKEVWAGLGGISLGAHAAGGTSLAFVEKCDIACQALVRNHGKVIQGDLTERHVRMQLHSVAPSTACVIAAGTPCQGFSVQGFGRGLQDSRSLTLLSVLQTTWLHQAYGLVLECVTEIVKHDDAMAAIFSLASRMEFQVRQVHLELGAQWASNRLRWWCVLLPQFCVDFELVSWPKAATWQTVGEVIGEWPVWPEEAEHSLSWTAQEREAYANPAYGGDQRVFNLRGKAPTALHSWGNALTACPCGCRTKGFCEASLQAKGLRGIGVLSPLLQVMRFPHPSEAGLLNTLPPGYAHLEEPRAALCLVGQLAAPLQSLWVFANIRRWAELCFVGSPVTEPEVLLETYKTYLIQQRRDLWITPSMLQPCHLWLQAEGPPHVVTVQGPIRVEQLLAAERKLSGFEGSLMDGCRKLPDHAWLHANSEAEPLMLKALPQSPPASLSPSSVEGSPKALTVPARSPPSTDLALWSGMQCLAKGKLALVFPPCKSHHWLELLRGPGLHWRVSACGVA